MSQDKAPLWTSNFILISLVNFQLVLVFYLLVIVIVGYSVAELGASTAQAGLVSGLFIVGTLLGRIIIGKLLNRLGLKLTLLSGLTGFFDLFRTLYDSGSAGTSVGDSPDPWLYDGGGINCAGYGDCPDYSGNTAR